MRALVLLILATATAAAAPPAPATRPKAGPPSATSAPRPQAAPAESAPTPPPEPAPSAPPRTPGPHDARVVGLLERIVKGPDPASRQTAIAELTAAAPLAIEAIGEWLVRPHTSDVTSRRAVLTAIEAEVPDDKGRFIPPRLTGVQKKTSDELDWLPKLLALDPAMPGVGETIADVAAIRALSATAEPLGGKLILDAAFNDTTMIYRDECGRYLRKMHPASLPPLTRASHGKFGDKKRYATFQLERLDRQDPAKALRATTGDEPIQLELIEAFRATRPREAVQPIWTLVNADSPRVREAARATWMDYITIRPPPPIMKKLFMAGGQLTKEEKPLWLTYRDLADNELRKAANELLGEDYPQIEDPSLDDTEKKTKTVKIDLLEVTKRLFAYYDGERAKKDSAEWAATSAKLAAGDLAGAITMMDRLLAANPEHPQRTTMAPAYLTWAKQLEQKQQWAAAAAAFSKAHGLDPKAATANDTLAAHHHALGKALEAAGKDGGPDYRKAVALKPDYREAQTAAARVEVDERRPTWVLIGALAAAAGALVLFAVAMLRRRAAHVR